MSTEDLGLLHRKGDRPWIDLSKVRLDDQMTVLATITAYPPRTPENSPPTIAEKLLVLIMPRGTCEALLGDLEEEFTDFIVPRVGVRLARIWYWRQAIGTIVAYVTTGALFGLVVKLIRGRG